MSPHGHRYGNIPVAQGYGPWAQKVLNGHREQIVDMLTEGCRSSVFIPDLCHRIREFCAPHYSRVLSKGN